MLCCSAIEKFCPARAIKVYVPTKQDLYKMMKTADNGLKVSNKYFFPKSRSHCERSRDWWSLIDIAPVSNRGDVW